MHKAIRAVAMSLALVIVDVSGARAQTQTQADADVKEIRAYRLTTAALDKVEKVVDAMAQWAKTDRQFQANIKLQAEVDSLRSKAELSESEQARLEKLEQQIESMEDEDDEGTTSIADMAAKIAEIPGAADALKRAGLTPREYIVFTFALFEASAYAEMKKSGLLKEAPKEVNAANVKFAEDHAARLKLLQEKAQNLDKQVGSGKQGS